MAKDKSVKKAAAPTAPVNGVKSGRVTKPAESVKTKSKDIAKAAAAKVTTGSKHKRKDSAKQVSSASEDDSDDETSESSESESESEIEDTKKAAANANGKVKGKPAADSSDSEDESSDSGDEAAIKPVNGKVANGANSSDASSDEDSEASDSSEEEEEKPKTNGAKAVKAVKPAADSDDSEDDDEDDSSENESDDEVKPAVKDVEMADDDDDSPDSDSSDDEGEEKPAVKEAPSKKRKAEAEPATPQAKRTKANGEEVGEPARNLFVGSLSWNVDEDWLRQAFDGFGTITSCRVITEAGTGRSKGFGYVEFSTIEEATAALDAKQGAELDGRALNVDFGKPRPDRSYTNEQVSARAQKFGDRAPNAPSATLFVGNLAWSVTQEMVGEAFQEYGTLNGVRLPTDQESGQPKGYGYVEFGSVDEATAAFDALNGADIGGRNIRLDYAGARPERSGGFNDSPRGGRGGFGGRGRGRGGFDRGGRGGGRGGRGDRGGFRGGRGNSSTNRGGFGDFKGSKKTF